MRLDDTDLRILAALQRNGRIQNVELAAAVGLSPSPCLRRVRILEEAGVIERYAALLCPIEVGFGLTVFVRVWLTAQDDRTVSRFTEAVSKMEQVLECHLMAGDCDFLLRVAARSIEDYRRFQSTQLARVEGVQNAKSEISMQRIKQTTDLPL